MGSPVFARSDVFGEKASTVGYAPTGQQPNPTAPYGAADPATLNTMYGAPSATSVQTGRLTYDDVIIKTGGLFALLVVAGALSWTLMPNAWPIAAGVGFVLALVNIFKREPSPLLITLYTVAQGVFLGGISAFYESWMDGIVIQAVLATVCTFGASLFLFRSGRVRVTPRFTRWLLIGLVGYAAFSLVNLVLMLFNVGGGDFGPMRSGPLGIVVGLVAVGLAAASLISDFDQIQRGVRNGAPAKFAWSAAFGLMVTLIWLYLEFLRLIAILRQ